MSFLISNCCFCISLFFFFFFCITESAANMGMAKSEGEAMTLETVRDSLVRQEDTIIFSLLDRANLPLNSIVYDEKSALIPGSTTSLLHYIIIQTETLQAKCGRYENPEENPFFPKNLTSSLVPAQNYTKILHPAGSSVNVNKRILEFYSKELIPLIAASGDDGKYASTASADLSCLQALSRRIHYGKFVAEIKFRDAPQDYKPAILAKDRDALMKLLTFKEVEEMVKKRVEKKAAVFGQQVTIDGTDTKVKPKIEPAVASRLYDEWVMPLTKLVQVEYLLRRLD